MSEPFAKTSGPRDASIVIVGEAFGAEEARAQRPFVGASGQELGRMLQEAGLDRSKILLTNVFQQQPPGNEVSYFCASRKEVGADYGLPPLSLGKYVRPAFFPELFRLAEELKQCSPNLVLALGNTAAWATMRMTGIGDIRGAVGECKLAPGLKVLPTYHPAAVLRNWPLRTTVVADLMKAKREAEFPEIRRPRREVWTRPSLGAIEHWYNTHGKTASILAADIETSQKQITMIGFSSTPSKGIVIPFVEDNGSHYWADLEDELKAWSWVQKLLELPTPKVFQNGMYDLVYITKMGLRPKNCAEDTMLFHHALYPELPKALGFLGSIYCQEQSWKLLGGRKSKDEAEKRDE